MTFLSEDPTYLAGALVLISGACWMMLRVTQQGKYLIWALTALAMALAVVVIEQLWVTDNERIEGVIYQLRQAVLAAKPDEVTAHLTPDVEYVQDGNAISGDVTRELIRANLATASFDFIHIHDLQTSAGRHTRRGWAEFRVYAKGTLHTVMGAYNVGTANSTWSLGFEETKPGVWKVNRITPVAISEGMALITRPNVSKTGSGQLKWSPGGVNPYFPGKVAPRRFRSGPERNRSDAPMPGVD